MSPLPAAQVISPPLHGEPPGRLQGHRHEGDKRVRDGQVEDKSVDISPTSKAIYWQGRLRTNCPEWLVTDQIRINNFPLSIF